jgi:hypothetical protein
MQLKKLQTENQEQTPNLVAGMRFSKIMSATFTDTRYKNRDGSTAKNAVIEGLIDGQTTPLKYHSTAKAIVDTLTKYFITDKQDSIENAEVVEIRSKDGRMYLALRGF